MGAVGAPEALNGFGGFPTGLEQEVMPPPLVVRALVGVVAATGAAGVREAEDALAIFHEGGSFGNIGAGRTAFDLPRAIGVFDDALRPARDLCDIVFAKVKDDLVEGGGDAGKRTEDFHKIVADLNGLVRDEGVAVGIEGRAGPGTSVFVDEAFHLLDGESVL